MIDEDYLADDYIKTFDVALEYFFKECPELKSVIVLNNNVYENLLSEVINDVLVYCKDNNVKIVNFDDYKIVYFLGISIANNQNNKRYLISMIKILNILIFSCSKIQVSKDMLDKIFDSIEKDKWKDYYGIYGIYSIFKICSKLDNF